MFCVAMGDNILNRHVSMECVSLVPNQFSRPNNCAFRVSRRDGLFPQGFRCKYGALRLCFCASNAHKRHMASSPILVLECIYGTSDCLPEGNKGDQKKISLIFVSAGA